MSEIIVHKLTTPFRKEPQPIPNIVLCWRHGSIPSNIDFVSTSINEVNCPKCWELWRAGTYV